MKRLLILAAMILSVILAILFNMQQKGNLNFDAIKIASKSKCESPPNPPDNDPPPSPCD